MASDTAVAERIIAVVMAKLEANKIIVAKAESGRVTWRLQKNGEIEVNLEPRI